MLDATKLKEALIQCGKVAPERLAEAESQAQSKGESLAQTLVSQLMIGFNDLGKCCETITGLRYVPLLPSAPSAEALRFLSPACSKTWNVFPVAFDVESNALTLAIHDPDQREHLKRVFDFLMNPHGLTFTIASEAEIQRACEKHLGTGARKKLSNYQPGQPFTLQMKKAPKPELKKRVSPDVPVEKRKKKPRSNDRPRSLPQPAYEEMSQSLINAATQLVRLQFADEPDRIHLIRNCVHYGQLMASRLGLSPVETDALVMASWLSALGESSGLSERLGAPYRLKEVLGANAMNDGRRRPRRIETAILTLVKCHQELKASEPKICRDVNLTRRELKSRWSSSPELQDMLEKFLQVLVDEEFLDKLSISAGRVLIIDAEELSRCELAPPLMGMGYDVIAIPDRKAAEEVMQEFVPDLILLSVEEKADRALWFCEKLKSEPETADVPILAVVDKARERLAVKALRAGANDFLQRPVNPELLFLKVQGFLSSTAETVRECGVSGSLDEMSFTDMIQILCAGRRSVDIVLNADHREGRVYIRDGGVVHAVIEDVVGESAFYEFMRWKEGIFTTQQCGECPERTIHVSAMSLLMEGARQVDETTQEPSTPAS